MRSAVTVLFVLSALAMVARAQEEGGYRGQVGGYMPPPSMYGGYGYMPPTTAAGSAMNGMANVISSKGSYNLQTSEAAINLTEAQSKEMQNHQQYENTYFSMKATNKAAQEAAAGPRPTMQELVKIAHEGVPTPLSTTQMDPITGGLNWPGFLQDDMFKTQRSEVGALFAKRAQNGGLSYGDRTTLHTLLGSMFGELKANIANVDPPDYIASRNYLNSLMYAGTKNELQ